jgi:hypothetical protein
MIKSKFLLQNDSFFHPTCKQQQQTCLQKQFYANYNDNYLIENNMYNKRQYLRVNFDQFTILNDEKKVQTAVLNPKLSRMTAPKETSVCYSWEKQTQILPKIKLVPTKVNKPDLDSAERLAEKRMKLVFQQKLEEERKQNDLKTRLANLQRQRAGSWLDFNDDSSAYRNSINSPNASIDSAQKNRAGNYRPNLAKENEQSNGTAAYKPVYNNYAPLIDYNTTKGFKYL